MFPLVFSQSNGCGKALGDLSSVDLGSVDFRGVCMSVGLL